MIDQKLKYRRFKVYLEGVLGRTFTDEEYDRIAETVRVSLEQSVMMGGYYEKALIVNPVYAQELFNLWINNQDDTDNLLKVMGTVAQQNPSVPPGTPETPPQPGGWTPDLSLGLHLVKSEDNGEEIFHTLRVPEGLLCCTYNIDIGPQIRRWDGQWHDEIRVSGRESFMKIIDPGDGQPIAITEHHAQILKRVSPGHWQESGYKRAEQPALGLGLVRAGSMVVGAIDLNDGSNASYVIKSMDRGRSWTDKKLPGVLLYGCGTDGVNVNLVGYQGGKAVMMNIEGHALFGVSVAPGGGWWSVCGDGQRWCAGSFSKYEDGTDLQGHIWTFHGSQFALAYTTDRPHVHCLDRYEGRWWGVATWDWNVANKSSLLLSSPTGLKDSWGVETEIPCGHIIGMSYSPAERVIFLSGGLHKARGEVYSWRIG